MKPLLLLLLLLAASCKYTYPPGYQPVINDSMPKPVITNAVNENGDDEDYSDSSEYQDEPFTLLKQCPVIADSTAFIKALRQNCHLYVHTRFITITAFVKTKLYGSPEPFYLVEYNWHDGAMAAYPWKGQILFDRRGNMVTIFNALRFQLVTIFPGERPFLLNCLSTARGNGLHEIIKIKGDTVENVLGTFKDNRPQTYDAGEDRNINEPNEFPFEIKDVNGDGYNDISFYGTIVHDPFENGTKVKRIRARFNFIYRPATGRFTEQEDYTKKYAYLEE